MDEVINQVKENWSKDLVIRFLYIKLAPYFQRDLLYFLAPEEQKEKEYMQGFINRFPNIVCSTLADFYVDLFKQFGINAKKVVANSAKIPLFAVIVEGECGWYFLDPISDLFSNQFGLKPYFFGIIPRYKTISQNYPELTKLPQEYINELDTELNMYYLDAYFSNLHKQLTNRNTAKEFFGLPRNLIIDLKERKFQFYNDELINIGNVNGLFERAQLYKYLNDRILNKSEKRYTKVKIVKEPKYYLSIELINYDGSIFFKEEKKDKQYILKKITSQNNLWIENILYLKKLKYNKHSERKLKMKKILFTDLKFLIKL